ncbi:MAG: protein TolQ [Gammaproteobacteria bacterium]
MDVDLSIMTLILKASLVVQLVMVILLVVSLMSWTIIFVKRRAIKQARAAAAEFDRRFWSGGELGEMYKQLANRKEKLHGLEAIFEAGFREFVHLRKQQGVEPMAIVEGAQRAMRVVLNREIETLETHLSFLATTGSTSPYVGLFGTVWGIMNAFQNLGQTQYATIADVAPGIAEALIATAMGLFAAIPAVVAYNRFANDVERLVGRYDNFADEFSTLLQRQAHVS